MLRLLEELNKSVYDVIIFDSLPSLVSNAQILSTRADGVIYVISQDIPGQLLSHVRPKKCDASMPACWVL
ncbi:MAG: hypothetical protein WA110_02255 [Anaerolineaceae bacterium]